MADASATIPTQSFSDDDIVFECPHCGKSLAIDKRGMGLTISCPDCANSIRVPTISDTLSEGADLIEMPSEELASALQDSREQVANLTHRLNELGARRESLEKIYNAQDSRMEQLRREFGNIQSALDRVAQVLSDD